MFTIYKITSEDQKNYIGCTKQKLSNRLSSHKNLKRPFILVPHTVEILETVEDFQQSQVLEAYYIEKFDSANPEKGWNRRFGGSKYSFPEWTKVGFGKSLNPSRPGELNGMFGKKHSEQTKEKMRKTALGRKGWSKGMKFSEERKNRMRQARAGKGFVKGENHPMFGRKHSEESKLKMSLSRKLRNSLNKIES
jgi:hypothetical protein